MRRRAAVVAWLASSTAILAAWAWSAVSTGDQLVAEAAGTVSTTSSSSSSDSGGSTSGSTDASGDSGATSGSTAASDGTYTGDVVSTRFGDVQVQVTVSGGEITDVTALALPDGDGHSARISQQVEEPLRSEALAAQSASISIISGATYTSRGYAQSLQSALDQAGL